MKGSIKMIMHAYRHVRQGQSLKKPSWLKLRSGEAK